MACRAGSRAQQWYAQCTADVWMASALKGELLTWPAVQKAGHTNLGLGSTGSCFGSPRSLKRTDTLARPDAGLGIQKTEMGRCSGPRMY